MEDFAARNAPIEFINDLSRCDASRPVWRGHCIALRVGAAAGTARGTGTL
jgi:hypothetical protein